MSPFHRNPRHPFVIKRQFLELQPASFSRVTREIPTPDWTCEIWLDCCIVEMARLWWNWQTRYFEVVVGQPVQVQVLLSAPTFLRRIIIQLQLIQIDTRTGGLWCKGFLVVPQLVSS